MVTIDTIEFEEVSEEAASAFQDKRRGLTFRVGEILQALSWWWMKRRTRARLADLDDSLLKDIGITKQQARAELEKSTYLY